MEFPRQALRTEMKHFHTDVENEFECLRVAMLRDGYEKEHKALQLLALLRTALKTRGYAFRPQEE